MNGQYRGIKLPIQCYTYIHIYIHTLIDTYIHTYIHKLIDIKSILFINKDISIYLLPVVVFRGPESVGNTLDSIHYGAHEVVGRIRLVLGAGAVVRSGVVPFITLYCIVI